MQMNCKTKQVGFEDLGRRAIGFRPGSRVTFVSATVAKESHERKGRWISVELQGGLSLPNFPSSEKFPVPTKEGE